jgi:hypothetical protein
MSLTLQSLCVDARRGPGVPGDVFRFAALQHQHAAAVYQQVQATPEGQRLRGGGDREAGVRLLAGSLSQFFQDDRLPGGLSTASMVAVGWWMSRELGSTAAELVEATAVGAEVGSRVGFALGGRSITEVDGRASAAAAAATGAWLAGMDGPGIAGAVARAVEAAPTLSLAALAQRPEDLGALPAIAALRALDAPSTDTGPPLHGPWGTLWLGRCLALKPLAGRQSGRVAVEAVEEILKRHVKAADKRLRADQVEKIEVRVELGCLQAEQAVEALGAAAPVGLSLRQRIGVLVAQHRLDASVLTASALAEKRAEIDAVAGRVVLKAGWVQSLAGAAARRAALAGLRSPTPLRSLPSLVKKLEPPPADQWGELLEVRPDRLLKELLVPGHGSPEKFRWEEPVEVKLYTNRGGWWPERRALPRGVGEDAEVVAQIGEKGGGTLLSPDSVMLATEWLAELGL